MLRFVPPKLVAQFAVFVDHGNSSGFFRTYNQLGPAKSAFRNQTAFNWRGKTHRAGKILELIDGDWFTLYDIPQGTEHLPWQKDFGVDSHWYNRRTGWHTVPMSAREYGDWRARVERERLNIFLAGTASASEGSNIATSEVH